MDGLRILVTGASGFVGSALVTTLTESGHTVRAMTRNVAGYTGEGIPIAGDVTDPKSLKPALRDIDVAYYLVHSLDSYDFEAIDADGATAFGAAAAEAGVRQIVYLGGLGGENLDLSPHLRSRRDVESRLGSAGVPVTVLRAAVIVGAGGVSWEMTRRLIKRLPLMAVPSWATTKIQPIGLDDVVRYLVGVAGEDRAIGRTFQIGGPEQLSYIDMMKRAGEVIHGRPVLILKVPILNLGPVKSSVHYMSAQWIRFITGVDQTVARNLIESMDNEVIVTDNSIRTIVPGAPMKYVEAVRVALADGVSPATRAARRA